MSRFTEAHASGVRAFTTSLEHTHRTCSECGFHDRILHGEWKTHVGTDPRTGHLQYRLTCPDCRANDVLDIDI